MNPFNCLFSKALTALCASTFFLAPLLNAEENFYRHYQEEVIGSGAGTPWSAERHLELVLQAKSYLEKESLNKRTYPISVEDLEEIFKKEKTDRIPFFAYSSMIDKEAGAVKAISPEGGSTQTAAIAFGIQRTFNREMAAATITAGWGPLERPNDLAILNIFYKEDAVLNGVLFDLSLDDLVILSKREVGYDLVPVVVMKWQTAIDHQKEPQMFIAYTFQAPDYKGEGERYTSPHVNPVPGYFNYLQKGIKNFGPDFTAMWWATTYLADQKTGVKELPYKIIDQATINFD
jgi:hypothetical protein